MIPNSMCIKMSDNIQFEELGLDERILLLKAFGYDVDEDGFILNTAGFKISSKEIPYKYIEMQDALLAPGSLEILDGTPTSISQYLRERVESSA